MLHLREKRKSNSFYYSSIHTKFIFIYFNTLTIGRFKPKTSNILFKSFIIQSLSDLINLKTKLKKISQRLEYKFFKN